MCGLKPCRKCAAKKARMSGVKIKKMAKKRSYGRRNNLVTAATNAAIAAGGYIAANQIGKLAFIQANPKMANIVKIGGGLALAVMTRNPILASVGGGMALNGIVGAVQQSGIAGLYGAIPGELSNWTPGVAGNGGQILLR